MEDIKTGECCHALGYVGYKNENEVSVTFYNKSGVQTSIEFGHKEARKLLSPISELPKYDPCRRFRKGDRVRFVMRDGRLPFYSNKGIYITPEDAIYTVEDSENDGFVVVDYKNGRFPAVHFSFLELVTPVEELEPYIVSNDDFEYCVFDQTRKMTVCRYDICHPHAKEAAEAECARLNAEHRKEQQ